MSLLKPCKQSCTQPPMRVRPVGNDLAADVHTAVLAASATVAAVTVAGACACQSAQIYSNSCYNNIKRT